MSCDIYPHSWCLLRTGHRLWDRLVRVRAMTSLITTPGANFDRGSKMILLASVDRILIAKEKERHSNDGCGSVEVQTLRIACA